MTTMATEEARHSTDGDLVRLLDDEPGATDAQVTAHVDACTECRSRLESLRRRSTLFSEVLAAAAPPHVDPARVRPPLDRLAVRPSGRRLRRHAIWSHAGLRAAAGILLMAGVAAATPARTWILERVARWRGGATQAGHRAPVQAPTPRPDTAASSAVFFAPASEDLVIRLEAQQATGALELIAGRESRSSAQLLGPASGEAFLVLPSELRIRNTARSAASYRIVLSTDIRHVRVVVGGDRAGQASLDVTPETRRVISLGRRGRGTP